MANNMSIPGELLSSSWIYWSSMAVLWLWLLTVILSLVLTAIAKRIAAAISQKENKGVLESASVGMVKVSILVDWLTSFGQKPIVLLSFDSVQLCMRVPVLTAGSHVLVDKEGQMINLPNKNGVRDAAYRSSFLTWFLEVTMPGTPLYPILRGVIVVLRTISPLFHAFGVTFSRFKVKIAAVDDDDGGKDLINMEICVNRATIRLVPDKSIHHGLSLVLKVYSFMPLCCASSSSNGLHLVAVNDDVLKLDMDTSSDPLTFFMKWPLSLDANESNSDDKKDDDGATPIPQNGNSYFIVPERASHVLLPKYTSLKIPPLAMVANGETLLQLIERIQSYSLLRCHDVLSSAVNSKVPETFYTCSSEAESLTSSLPTEVPGHSYSSPSCLTGTAASSHKSRQSIKWMKIISKFVECMKVEIWLEELKAKLVTSGKSSEVILNSLMFNTNGVHQTTPSCQFDCLCASMSIRTTGGGGDMTVNQDIEEGKERMMFTLKVLKCTSFIEFISFNQIHTQINGCISSPSVVITDKDVNVALGFIPLYNSLCGLHMALKDSGRMVKTVPPLLSDESAGTSTIQLEVALALTVSDIEVKALTTRRCGAPPLENAAAEGGGNAEGSYDFDPAVILFHLPELKLHWSQDHLRVQPLSITLGTVKSSFQLAYRPVVPWFHLASLEMIVRQDPHIPDTAGIVVFPNITINALSLQLHWTPPAVFVIASLMSSVVKSCVDANVSQVRLNPAFSPLNYPRSGNVTGGNHSQQSNNSSWFLPRDADEMAACFACNFSSMGSEYPSGSHVIANVFDVTVYIPQAPLSHKAGDLTEDSTLRWLDGSLSEPECKMREDWTCECVSVEHVRIGVPTQPTTPITDGGSSSHPSKTSIIEIIASFAEITVGPADCGTGGCGSVSSFMEGWCGKQFVTKPSPYLFVDKFAVRKLYARNHMSVCVDVMSKGIRGKCTPYILNRVFGTSQGITLAVWLTMLMVKRSRAQSTADIEALDKNLPWDSEIALQYWLKHWQSVIAEGCDAPSGDTLIRLNFCDVDVTANFPAQFTDTGEMLNAMTANVRAGTFGSDSAPEHFLFEDVSLSLKEGEDEKRDVTSNRHYHELVGLSKLSVKSTLQSFVSSNNVRSYLKSPSSPQMLISNAFYEIRARANACGIGIMDNLPENLSSLIFQPMGFLIEARGIKLSLKKDHFVAKSIEQLMSHTFEAFSSIEVSGGRWHPAAGGPSGDFHHLFWKPPLPREYYDSGNGLSPGVMIWGEKIWLHLHDVLFTIGDDPMEGWLNALAPVWLSHLADQEVITKLHDWPNGGGAIPLLMERRAEEDYICEARKALAMSQQRLVEIELSNLSVDVSPPLNGNWMCAPMLRKLGRDFSTSTRTRLMKTSLELELKGISVRIRRADKPLVSLPHLKVDGDVLLVTNDFQTRAHTTPSSSTMSLMKGGVLLDIKCNVGDMSFNYCPAALAGIEELALTMHTLCPPYIVELVGKDVAWWDMCRALIDGQVEVLTRNTSIYLSKSHRTASASCHRTATHCLSCGSCKRASLQSVQDEETIIVKVSMACVIIPSKGPRVTLEAAGLSLELLGLHDLYPEMVEPPCLIYTPPFLVAPIMKASIGMDWAVDDKKYHPLHSSGVVFHLSAEILGLKDYPSEGPLNQFLYEVGKDVSPLSQSLPSQLEINFFGVNLVSFWRWLSCFVLERSPPLPPKCMVENGGPGILSFSRHIHGFHLEHLGVSKADIALLHTDPGDPFRRGIRFSFQSGFTFAIVLAMEKVRGKCGGFVMPDPFETGRLAIPSLSKQVWTFSGLEVHTEGEGIEIRLVSHEAGPHGAFLVSTEGLHISQSGGSMEEVVDPTMVSDANGVISTYDVSVIRSAIGKWSKHRRSVDKSSGSISSGGIIPDMSLFTSVYLSERQESMPTLNNEGDDDNDEGSAANKSHHHNPSKLGQQQCSSTLENSLKTLDKTDDLWFNDESSTSRSQSASFTSDVIPTSDLQSNSVALAGEKGGQEFRRGSFKACQAHFSRLLDEKRERISKLTTQEKLDNDQCETAPQLERDKPYGTCSTATTTTPSNIPSLPSNPRLPSSSAAVPEDHAMGSEFLFEVTVEQPRVLLSPFILDSLAILAQDILELVTSAIPMSAAPPAELLKRHHPNGSQYHLNGQPSHSPYWGIDMPANRGEQPRQSEELVQQISTMSSDYDATDLVPEIMHKLFSIEAVALQVQLRDEEESRSCAVWGVRSAVVQGWVGLNSGMRTDEDESNASRSDLQYLAQRLLHTSQEAITLTLKGAMLFVAPTDIDVAAGVMWLPCDVFSLSGGKSPCEPEKELDHSSNAPDGIKGFILSGVLGECSSSDSAPFSGSGLGIFRPVVRAIPLIILQVLAKHGYPENHIIHLSVPPVLFEMDGKHQVWLFNVVSSVLFRGLPPDLMKQWKQNAKRRREVISKKKEMETQQQQNDNSNAGVMFSSLSYIPSAGDVSETVDVAQAWLDLRRLRWDLRLLLRLKEELEKVERCTQGTRPPRVVVVTFEAWAAHADRLIKYLEVVTAEAVIWLRHLVKESTKLIAQKPFTQIIADLRGLETRLMQEESAKEAFFVVAISSVVVNMSVYDDESGRIDIGVKCCTAHWLDSRKHVGINKGEEAAAFNSQSNPPGVHKGGLFVTENGSFRNIKDPLNSSGRFSALNFMTVLAPVTTKDLPMVSSGALRRWTKKDDTIHVQAILAAPSSDSMPVLWHVEISVVPLLVRLHGTLFDNFERYGDVCAATSHKPRNRTESELVCSRLWFVIPKTTTTDHNPPAHVDAEIRISPLSAPYAAALSVFKAKDEFLIPRASANRIKSKHGVKKDRGSAITAKPAYGAARPSHTNIAEDGGYYSEDKNSNNLRSPRQSGAGGPIKHSHYSETVAIPVQNDAPGVPFFKRHLILQHGRLGELNIFVSYTGGKSFSVAPESALEELDNFHLKLHPKTYINKTWSLQMAQTRIKRDAILDIFKQVQRNFDNFGRFLALQMGVKMRPPSKTTVDVASIRAENSGAAANTYRGKGASADEVELYFSQHEHAATKRREPFRPDSTPKLVRDSQSNRSYVSVFSGEQTQLRLEDIPECNNGPDGGTEKVGVSIATTDSEVSPAPPMISTTAEGDQWPFKTHKNPCTGTAEATGASTFLRPEKKSKGRLTSKIGRSLNLRRRFSTNA